MGMGMGTIATSGLVDSDTVHNTEPQRLQFLDPALSLVNMRIFHNGSKMPLGNTGVLLDY